MSLEIDAEPAMKQIASLTKIAPATFRGVDCAVLAERYVAFRRGLSAAAPAEEPDVIRITPEAKPAET